jgi:Protein of unknown function (DUF3102)
MSVCTGATVQTSKQLNGTSGFDYTDVSSSVAKFLRGQVERIRRTAGRSIIEIGKDLIGAKHYLSHGGFLRWVESEVGIPARTAQAYMQVAQWVSSRNMTMVHLPPTLLYILSAPSTPESFITDILKRAEAGEQIHLQAIRGELKARREAKCEQKHSDVDRDPQLSDGIAVLTPATSDKGTSIVHAVTILARVLSRTQFLTVRDIMTSKHVLDDPELAQKIAAAFQSVQESPPRLQITQCHPLAVSDDQRAFTDRRSNVRVR